MLYIINDALSNNVYRIFTECDPRNICSYALLESLNYRRKALLRKNVSFKNDTRGNAIYQDTYVYGLLISDLK